MPVAAPNETHPMSPDDAAALHDAALHDADQFDAAEAAYRQLLVDQPDDPALLTSLADVLADAGRGGEAASVYQRVIDAAPDAAASADAYDGLATVRQEAGDVDGAILPSRRAAELRADADQAYRLGYTLDQMSRFDDAAAAYQLAADLRPSFAEAHAKVATHLLRRHRPAEAAAAFATAADVGPAIAEIHCNLAVARRLAGDEDGALKAARRAVELKPDLAAAHNVLGSVFQDRRRPTEALAAFRRAIELKPDLVDAVNNIGIVLERIGRVAEAGTQFERAVALEPRAPQYHVALGGNRLLRGDLAGGWAELDWRRLDRAVGPPPRAMPRPLWDGSPLGGRTVLLTAESTVSDLVQFIRYAALVAGRGGRVIVECDPSLAAVARTAPGVAGVTPAGPAELLPAHDVYCPLGTLPLLFNTTLMNVPAAVPYLSADPAKAAAFAARLPSARRRVGLCWAGDPSHRYDRARSMAPARLSPLSAVPEVAWVSLQRAHPDRPAADVPIPVTDFTADLHDWSDTAALVASLDAVVTVDTAVAHLAGAMGKPVLILLPTVPHWRWMLGRPDSPWYPSARLFRQPDAGDWPAAVKGVAAALGG